MTSQPIDKRTLLRQTLIIAGALVGACVVFVGALTVVAASVVGHVVTAPASDSSSEPSDQAHVQGSRMPSGVSHSPNGADRN